MYIVNKPVGPETGSPTISFRTCIRKRSNYFFKAVVILWLILNSVLFRSHIFRSSKVN